MKPTSSIASADSSCSRETCSAVEAFRLVCVISICIGRLLL